MLTVGYGDFVPQNTTERIFVICVALLACGVFAFAINSIGGIIKDMNEQNDVFKKKMSLLTRFMKKRGMRLHVQMKVRKYFEYM